jgi:hypothetical protein
MEDILHIMYAGLKYNCNQTGEHADDNTDKYQEYFIRDIFNSPDEELHYKLLKQTSP